MTALSTDHPYAETAADYLAAWDRGEPVWTLEMGGIGPGYEQAIQVLVAELIRDNINKPLPLAEGDAISWRTWGDETVWRVNESCRGFSGAQVGAAKTLAVRYLIDGPRAFFDRVKEEAPERHRDLILVSKEWPHA